jgi:hypothetical protein
MSEITGYLSPYRSLVKTPRDRSREGLTAQAQAILARLRVGEATSLEIQRAAHCVSHTARVSELRRRGFEIECKRERTPTGDRCTYTLVSEP